MSDQPHPAKTIEALTSKNAQLANEITASLMNASSQAVRALVQVMEAEAARIKKEIDKRTKE